MSRPLILLLVLMCALGAGLWFLGGDESKAPGPILELDPLNRIPTGEPQVPDSLDLEERISPPTPAVPLPHPLVVELSLLIDGGVPLDETLPTPRSGARARLSGRLLGPAGRPVTGKLTFLYGTNRDRELETDSSGRFGASDLWPGLAVVRVATVTGLVAEREVILRNLSEAKLGISWGATALVKGRVTDPFGEGIPAAEVTVDGNRTFTDDEGRFLLPRVAPGQRIIALARVAGRATHREVLAIGRRSVVDEDRLIFRLKPGAKLEVVVSESLGAQEPVQVHLFPAGGMAGSQRQFPWEEYSPVSVPPGGRVMLEDLPPETITLVPFHSGAVAVPPQINIKLVATRSNVAVLHMRPGPVIRGTVVIDGEPVGGARVVLDAPDPSVATTKALGRSPTYHQQAIFSHVHAGHQEVRTNNRGRFVLSVYPAISERWYLRAESLDGSLVAQAIVAGGREDIVLELVKPDLTPGVLAMDLPPHLRSFDLDVQVQGAPRDRVQVHPGSEHVVDNLSPGLWAMNVRYRGERLMQGNQVQIEADGTARITLPLPAIASQPLPIKPKGDRRTGPPPLERQGR
ncbi:MAG TPA: carboxypeptidase regulatory-like domain-containing protein [Planctomycetes bacterium]|nr:carboxypeptidase regulatory-like domain-containing protein [Planctomycetota bacterium]HIL35878.1 carboxypeptidase regulatory-like domain-containing protein [Planctomycetota bacterium]